MLLDALGLGPVEAPYREVFKAPGASLRRYGGGDETGPTVLIVPAPIKRPYIWDLAPDVSVVRRCLARGMRVFLVDWQPAPPAAVLPVVEAAAGRDKTVLHYDGDVGVSLQHVGPLAGRRAHALLWPRILDWIERVG